jgi:hypothetical protein
MTIQDWGRLQTTISHARRERSKTGVIGGVCRNRLEGGVVTVAPAVTIRSESGARELCAGNLETSWSGGAFAETGEVARWQ